jgi:hypothetical protein
MYGALFLLLLLLRQDLLSSQRIEAKNMNTDGPDVGIIVHTYTLYCIHVLHII